MRIKSETNSRAVIESHPSEMIHLLGMFFAKHSTNAIDIKHFCGNNNAFGESIYQIIEDRENECPIVQRFRVEWEIIVDMKSPTKRRHEYWYRSTDDLTARRFSSATEVII